MIVMCKIIELMLLERKVDLRSIISPLSLTIIWGLFCRSPLILSYSTLMFMLDMMLIMCYDEEMVLSEQKSLTLQGFFMTFFDILSFHLVVVQN